LPRRAEYYANRPNGSRQIAAVINIADWSMPSIGSATLEQWMLFEPGTIYPSSLDYL
jgi:hypothetical protein